MRAGQRWVPEQRTVEARANNRDRLAEVYAAYWPFTVRFLSRQVRDRDRHSVEDLAQDTFLRAWPHLHRVREHDEVGSGSLRPWLAVLARSAACAHYRGGAGKQRIAEAPVAPDSPLWRSGRAGTVVSGADAVEERVDLQAALSRLPAETRQAVELRVGGGMPLRDVAARMHRDWRTVRRLTDEGLATLREHIGEGPAPAPPTVDPMVRERRAAPGTRPRPTGGRDRRAAEAVRAQQECLRLRFTQGLSIAETAAAMGRTEGAVRALQYRADQALRTEPADNPTPRAPASDTVDPMVRARRAVAEVRERRAGHERQAVEEARAGQVARWHADDRTTDVQHRGDGRGMPALVAEGGMA